MASAVPLPAARKTSSGGTRVSQGKCLARSRVNPCDQAINLRAELRTKGFAPPARPHPWHAGRQSWLSHVPLLPSRYPSENILQRLCCAVLCCGVVWCGALQKEKGHPTTTTTDDKRLQNTLKRLGVNTIPGIERGQHLKDESGSFASPKGMCTCRPQPAEPYRLYNLFQEWWT